MASPSASKDSGSRIPNFFKMTIRERLDALRERDLLSDDDIALLVGRRSHAAHPDRGQDDRERRRRAGSAARARAQLPDQRPRLRGAVVRRRTVDRRGLVGRGAHRAIVRRLQVERDRSDPDRPGAAGRHGRSAAGDGSVARAPRRNRQPREQPAPEDGRARRRRPRHRTVPLHRASRTAADGGGAPARRHARRDGRQPRQHACARASPRWSSRSPAARCSCASCRTSPIARWRARRW